MTTDIVRHEPVSSLELAPQAWKLAEKIATTEMVPTALRGRPEAVLAVMLAGHEAGVSPMQSLQKIHIIEGRPAMSSELMRALVMQHGHELIYEEVTTTKVTAAGRRKGSDRWTKVTWTMDDAKRGGLEGKQNWRKWPRAMLTARATAELCRMVFPDVLAGISHTIEELSDGDAVGEVDFGPAEVVQASTAPAPAKPTTQRAAITKSAPADDVETIAPAPRGEVPGLPDEPTPPPTPEVDEPEEAEVVEDEHGLTEADADGASDIVDAEVVEPEEDWPSGEWDSGDFPTELTPETMKRYTGPQIIAIKLADLFDIKGSGEQARADRLAAIVHIIGRPIASSKDLTPEETSTIISILDNWPAGEPLYEPESETTQEAEPEPETPETEPEPPIPTKSRPPRSSASAPPAATRPEDWTGDAWRDLLAARKVKVTEAMTEARRLAALAEVASPATLDDIAGTGIAADLVGWVEDLSLERRK